jgi:hypothetical protein
LIASLLIGFLISCFVLQVHEVLMRVVQYLDEPSALLQLPVVMKVVLHKITTTFTANSSSSSSRNEGHHSQAVAAEGGEEAVAAVAAGGHTARSRAAAAEGVFDLGLSLANLKRSKSAPLKAASDGQLPGLQLQESRSSIR